MKKWVKDWFLEILNQTFTLLGMFIAWVVLEGSAKTVVGWAILWATLTLQILSPSKIDDHPIFRRKANLNSLDGAKGT